MAKKPQDKNNGRQGGGNPNPKPNPKPEGHVGEGTKPDASQSGTSGMYWPNKELLNDVATVNFNYRLGDHLPLLEGDRAFGYVTPGVTRITYAPTFGKCVEPGDALNKASVALYSYVRRFVNKNQSYDPADMMIQIGALDSIYQGVLFCQRALAYLRNFSWNNKYTPKAVIEAMGVKYDKELLSTQPNLRARLNIIVDQCTSLPFPLVFPMIERHGKMAMGVYTDSDVSPHQYYVFTPSILYRFALDTTNKHGKLIAEEWCPSGAGANKTLSEYIDQLQVMVDAIYGDNDAANICGDLLSAFPDSKIAALANINGDTILEPAYDSEFVQQIHNAMPVDGALFQHGLWDVTQVIEEGDSGLIGYIKARPFFSLDEGEINKLAFAGNRIVDTAGSVDPESIMYNSRFMVGTPVAVYDENAYVHGFTFAQYGSEIVTGIYVYTYAYDGVTDEFTYLNSYKVPSVVYAQAGYSVFNEDLEAIFALSSFDGFPLIYANLNTPEQTASKIRILGQLRKFCPLSADRMDRIHECATFGLWNTALLR